MSSIGALSQITTSFFSKVFSHEQPTPSETQAVEEALSASVDAQLIQDMRVNSLATQLASDQTIVKIVTTSGSAQTTEIKLSDASLFDFSALESSPSLSTIETLNVAGLGGGDITVELLQEVWQRVNDAEQIAPAETWVEDAR